MCSARDDAALPAPGLPIRESADQRPFSAYPRLIAAVHALLRLLMPRHPPSALNILTVIAPDFGARIKRPPPAGTVMFDSLAIAVRFSRSAERRPRAGSAKSAGLRAAVSQNSTAAPPRGADRKAFPEGTAKPGRHSGAAAAPSARPTLRIAALPRKEVSQPPLPVRLPCYDFTPVTGPTFDGSLPKGWATGFGGCLLPWCDGRCVQGPGSYSPRQC